MGDAVKHYFRHQQLDSLPLLLVLVSAIVAPTAVLGELGVVRLTFSMNAYENSNDRLLDDTFCDGYYGGITCDMRFSITISTTWGDRLYNYHQPDSYDDTHAVAFGPTLGKNRGNPFKILLRKNVFQFGKIKLHVSVVDVDNGAKTEAMDSFETWLSVRVPHYQEHHIVRNSNRKPPSSSFLSVSHSALCDDPLAYDWDCSKYCKPHSDKFNGYYTCSSGGDKVCLPGWSEVSQDCKVPTMCSVGPCKNGGTCVELSASKDYWCACTAYFMGKNCELGRNPCKKNDCLNGGTCADIGSGKIMCTCPWAYKGDRCEIEADRCAAFKPCGAHSTCYPVSQGFTCACNPGYKGLTCNVEIDECNQGKNPCANGGTCVNQPGTFTCLCPPGLLGRLCEEDINECQAVPPPCKPSYQCINTIGGHRCVLLDKDECVGVVCGGGGTCIDLLYKYYCQCPAGFSDIACNHSVGQDIINRLLDGGSLHRASPFAVAAVIAASLALRTAWPDGLW